ncbi:hypothetical protein SLA2020_429300 [Shorea laevis]
MKSFLANKKFTATGPIPRNIVRAWKTLPPPELLFLNNRLTGCLPYEIQSPCAGSTKLVQFFAIILRPTYVA